MSDRILKIEGVHKAFASPEGPIKVLEGVSFGIGHGESLSIRGESGAGKTTLLNIITLLERPDVGTVYWEGEDVTLRRNSWLARRRGGFMGLVFQSYYLMPEFNAFDNVLMARRLVGGSVRNEDRKRVYELLDSVGLGKRARHLPSQLSGGECQRVALARALMNRPKVLVADEPTGNLDEKTGRHVMDLLLGLCQEQGTSLMLVTHNPDFAKETQRQVVLSMGKIVE